VPATICWLPDIARWAEIVVQFLKPGGALYFAEAHPVALVLDDETPCADDRPGFFIPYFQTEALILNDHRDYADPMRGFETRARTNSCTRWDRS
jgi:hypothetical protein